MTPEQKVLALLDDFDVENHVSSVPRNDLAAAREFYQRRGHITSDEAESLVMLQDDPTKLLEIMATWKVVEPKKE